jgi:hypothetical protein
MCSACVHVCVCIWTCVCVCVREREREAYGAANSPTCPMPWLSPMCIALMPMAPSRGSALESASWLPPHMKVREAFVAPGTPPETGASMKRSGEEEWEEGEEGEEGETGEEGEKGEKEEEGEAEEGEEAEGVFRRRAPATARERSCV